MADPTNYHRHPAYRTDPPLHNDLDTSGPNYPINTTSDAADTTIDLDLDADPDIDDTTTTTDRAGRGAGVEAIDRAIPGTGMRVKTTSFEHGEGTTVYDPETGAYDQMLDYRTEDSYRHHRERVTEEGIYQQRDVKRGDDGSERVHREYENPITGTRFVRDFER